MSGEGVCVDVFERFLYKLELLSVKSYLSQVLPVKFFWTSAAHCSGEMACMKLGSKSDAFQRQGQAWYASCFLGFFYFFLNPSIWSTDYVDSTILLSVTTLSLSSFPICEPFPCSYVMSTVSVSLFISFCKNSRFTFFW